MKVWNRFILKSRAAENKQYHMLCVLIGYIFWVWNVHVSQSQVSCFDAYACVNQTINATSHVYLAGYKSGAGSNSKISITSGSGIDTQISGALGAYKMSQLISPDVITYVERGAAYIKNDPYGIIADYVDCHGALSCAGSSIYIEEGTLMCRTGEACARSELTVTSLIEARGTYSLANSVIRPAQDDLTIKFYGHLAGYNTTIICDNEDHICSFDCYGNSCFNTKFICHENAACDADCDDDISRFCPVMYYVSYNDTWDDNGMCIQSLHTRATDWFQIVDHSCFYRVDLRRTLRLQTTFNLLQK